MSATHFSRRVRAQLAAFALSTTHDYEALCVAFHDKTGTPISSEFVHTLVRYMDLFWRTHRGAKTLSLSIDISRKVDAVEPRYYFFF